MTTYSFTSAYGKRIVLKPHESRHFPDERAALRIGNDPDVVLREDALRGLREAVTTILGDATPPAEFAVGDRVRVIESPYIGDGPDTPVVGSEAVVTEVGRTDLRGPVRVKFLNGEILAFKPSELQSLAADEIHELRGELASLDVDLEAAEDRIRRQQEMLRGKTLLIDNLYTQIGKLSDRVTELEDELAEARREVESVRRVAEARRSACVELDRLYGTANAQLEDALQAAEAAEAHLVHLASKVADAAALAPAPTKTPGVFAPGDRVRVVRGAGNRLVERATYTVARVSPSYTGRTYVYLEGAGPQAPGWNPDRFVHA